MIYSADINKICAVCRHAQKSDETHILCKLKNEYMPISCEACPKFIYDIFKRPARRKRKLKTNFSPDDFTL